MFAVSFWKIISNFGNQYHTIYEDFWHRDLLIYKESEVTVVPEETARFQVEIYDKKLMFSWFLASCLHPVTRSSQYNFWQLSITEEGNSFHALLLIARLADGDSLMCYIVTMGRQTAKMFLYFLCQDLCFSCCWATLATENFANGTRLHWKGRYS